MRVTGMKIYGRSALSRSSILAIRFRGLAETEKLIVL